MNWAAVAESLENQAIKIRETAQSGFPGDFETQKEMRARACLLKAMADALFDGLDADKKGAG